MFTVCFQVPRFGPGFCALFVCLWVAVVRAEAPLCLFLDDGESGLLAEEVLKRALPPDDDAGQALQDGTQESAFKQRYPGLFQPPQEPLSKKVFAGLKSAIALHYEGEFRAADSAFRAAFDDVLSKPFPFLESPQKAEKLIQGITHWIENTEFLELPQDELDKRVAEVMRYFSSVELDPGRVSPKVALRWTEIIARNHKRLGTVSLRVLRGGQASGHASDSDAEMGLCSLWINGVLHLTFSDSAKLKLPLGEHFLKLSCEEDESWHRRVEVQDESQELLFPLSWMAAVKFDKDIGCLKGGVDFESSRLPLQTLVPAASFPLRLIQKEKGGSLSVKEISREDLEVSQAVSVSLSGASNRGKKPRISPWSWATAGIGVGALLGGLATNLAYFNYQKELMDSRTLEATKIVSISLYSVGGVMVLGAVTAMVIELTGDAEEDEESVVFKNARFGGRDFGLAVKF